MIIVLKPQTEPEQIKHIVDMIEKVGLRTHISAGEHQTIIGVIGDKTKLANYPISSISCVESVVHVSKPYKMASRDFHPEDTIIDVKGAKLGGGNLWIVAGPCSIESEDQLRTVAKFVKNAGANLLRGGAYKPRTSPYSFQGLGEEGLKLLKKIGEETSLATVTEVMDTADVELVAEYADVLQIGTRNAQNFSLLKQVGKLKKPIVLKRGMSQTIEEWLMSAEYIMSEGNQEVVLCERGIRTFETAYRNTFDVLAIPVLKERTHLPIIVDPSHASGMWQYVIPMALAGLVSGADGVMIEAHHEPEKAMSDGAQSLKPKKFDLLMSEIRKIAPVVGKGINL
ncbi:MAG: 3-deoxy-7-phosphoheptulonate synthase [Spirochaetes bacterium GWF1_51_8]|nr:MAG: 3-deoxy-7-phosphoheptulonate synthase [Spirochaetes bacterium GWF1_51_8]